MMHMIDGKFSAIKTSKHNFVSMASKMLGHIYKIIQRLTSTMTLAHQKQMPLNDKYDASLNVSSNKHQTYNQVTKDS